MRNIIATLILLFLSGLQVAPGGSTPGDEKDDGAKRTKFLHELTPDEYFTVRGEPDMRYVLLMPEGMSLTPARERKQHEQVRDLVLLLAGCKDDRGGIPLIESVKKDQRYYHPGAVFCVLLSPPSGTRDDPWGLFLERGRHPISRASVVLEKTLDDVKRQKLFTSREGGVFVYGECLSAQAALNACCEKDAPFNGVCISMQDPEGWLPQLREPLRIPKAAKKNEEKIRFFFIHEGSFPEPTTAIAEALQKAGHSVKLTLRQNGYLRYPDFAEGFAWLAEDVEVRR